MRLSNQINSRVWKHGRNYYFNSKATWQQQNKLKSKKKISLPFCFIINPLHTFRHTVINRNFCEMAHSTAERMHELMDLKKKTTTTNCVPIS